jgi:hypothetical protein
MTIEEIMSKITELAKQCVVIDEDSLSDFDDGELLEWQANGLIISYCEENEYLINGFPTEKRKLSEEELDDDDYFCRNRFDLYQDILTYQKDDVAELMWHFTESFWPGTFDYKKDYVESAKARAEDSGFYDVTL